MQHQKFTWSQCGTNVHVALLWLRFSHRHLSGTITFLPSSPIRTPQKRTLFYCDGFLLEQNRYKQARQHYVLPLDLERLVPLDLNPPFICRVCTRSSFCLQAQFHINTTIVKASFVFYLICFDFDRETKETTTG